MSRLVYKIFKKRLRASSQVIWLAECENCPDFDQSQDSSTEASFITAWPGRIIFSILFSEKALGKPYTTSQLYTSTNCQSINNSFHFEVLYILQRFRNNIKQLIATTLAGTSVWKETWVHEKTHRSDLAIRYSSILHTSSTMDRSQVAWGGDGIIFNCLRIQTYTNYSQNPPLTYHLHNNTSDRKVIHNRVICTFR